MLSLFLRFGLTKCLILTECRWMVTRTSFTTLIDFNCFLSFLWYFYVPYITKTPGLPIMQPYIGAIEVKEIEVKRNFV